MVSDGKILQDYLSDKSQLDENYSRSSKTPSYLTIKLEMLDIEGIFGL